MPERLAFEQTIRNQALVIGAVSQRPRLTDRSIDRKRREVQTGKPAPLHLRFSRITSNQ